jgi:hypothetical protein
LWRKVVQPKAATFSPFNRKKKEKMTEKEIIDKQEENGNTLFYVMQIGDGTSDKTMITETGREDF